MLTPFAARLIGATLIASLLLTSVSIAQTDPEPLQPELDRFAADFASKAPARLRDAFAEGLADVRRLGLVETALNVGDRVPVATLETPAGESVDTAALWADGPVVITFYRGGWCPYCNLSLKALQRSLDAIDGAGAKLVAVTPELPEHAAETVGKNELSFAVLTDRDNRLARAMGIVFPLPDAIRPIYEKRIGLARYNGNDRNELPLAATYLVDTEGVIRWAFLDVDYKRRAEPADIVAAAQQLSE